VDGEGGGEGARYGKASVCVEKAKKLGSINERKRRRRRSER
jgi:hypothetical protein